MTLFSNILYKKTIYFARRDIIPETVNKYCRYILIIFTVIFLLTALSYDFSSDGVMFGVTISLKFIISIIEMFLLGVFIYVIYLYNTKFDSFIEQYSKSLSLDDLTYISCVFSDSAFKKTTYKILNNEGTGYYFRNKYIEIESQNYPDKKERYYFNDYRIFKFVDIKNGRKLKLENLSKNVG